eukprot:CAMPEP_0197672694 /NCGR_PEP_ID=MMETSP1338-20131121/79481_1 /TAXON_ID=43686 ORGANISM="Pelagodinium beii, Strain RCC1491" /NCGR_SAMPLE_ID=MMETSP1338 /ASSEMBLY_ACC=CAM_ASM_000754 /LENGTH=341 /DNA_ID=CAMNT_0043252831 /DNA_START=60 /DNA_END=1081 /DNA_ORIENTATION=+
MIISGRVQHATKRMSALRRIFSGPEEEIEEDYLEEMEEVERRDEAKTEPKMRKEQEEVQARGSATPSKNKPKRRKEQKEEVQEPHEYLVSPRSVLTSISTCRYIEGLPHISHQRAQRKEPQLQEEKPAEVLDKRNEEQVSEALDDDFLQQYHEQREALNFSSQRAPWRPSPSEDTWDQQRDFSADFDLYEGSPEFEFENWDWDQGAGMDLMSWGKLSPKVKQKRKSPRNRPRMGYPNMLPDVTKTSPRRHPSAVHGPKHNQFWVSDLRPGSQEEGSLDQSDLALLQSTGSAILAGLRRREAELLFQTGHPAHVEFREHRKPKWSRPATKDLRFAYRSTWSG